MQKKNTTRGVGGLGGGGRRGEKQEKIGILEFIKGYKNVFLHPISFKKLNPF